MGENKSHEERTSTQPCDLRLPVSRIHIKRPIDADAAFGKETKNKNLVEGSRKSDTSYKSPPGPEVSNKTSRIWQN